MSNSLVLQASAELERRRRLRLSYTPPDLRSFARLTKIETPHDEGAEIRPFELWPSQIPVFEAMENQRLLAILKARQLGISWLACLYSLYVCVSRPSQTVLLLSQGQTEANELIRRVLFMYGQHRQKARMPQVRGSNMSTIRFENGSRVRSLPATKKAGRSFTASVIILDEYAFMEYNKDLFAAAKPTIDGGGKMFIISSADGNGSHYHQFWQMAQAGVNGFYPIFLPWDAHPDRYPEWRNERIREAHETSDIYREYPSTTVEAFTHATGLVYEQWDESESVTVDAEFVTGGGEVYWAVDDGYSGRIDPVTGYYTSDSHPRVFLLCQLRHDGTLCVFDESYEVQMLSDEHINHVLELGYPHPEIAAVDKSAAELKGRLQNAGIFTRNGPSSVSESVKEVRHWIAADKNKKRRLLVHPRCHHLRGEFAQYRYHPDTGRIVKAFDHGPDAVRYLVHSLRNVR